MGIGGQKGDGGSVYLNSNTMKFRAPNASTRKHILRRGMWNLAGIPVVMFNWYIEEDQPEEKSVPLWVHLKHVPMNMVSWKGLSLITSPVGVPVRLHPETAQCVNLKSPNFFVNADLTKELPKSMVFNLNGKETLVEYNYPWLPSRCTNCMKWGHLEQACVAPKMTPEVQTNMEVEDGEIVGSLSNESATVKTQTETETHVLDLQKEKENEQSPMSGNDDRVLIDIAEENLVSPKVTEESKSEEVGISTELEWSDVSPGKASRSPKKKIRIEQVLTTSRFSILTLTEEENEKGEEHNVVTDQEGSKETDHDGSEKQLIPESVEATHKNTNHTRDNDQNVVIMRQSLPRDSKNKHKFVSDPTAQKAKETAPLASIKKLTRKHH